MVGRCPESFSKSVTLLAASVATGVHRQFPGQDLHLQGTQRLCTALRIMRTRLGAALGRVDVLGTDAHAHEPGGNAAQHGEAGEEAQG